MNRTDLDEIKAPVKRDAFYLALKTSEGRCDDPLKPEPESDLSKVLNFASIANCYDAAYKFWSKQICNSRDHVIEWKSDRKLFENVQKLDCKTFRVTTFHHPPAIYASKDGSVKTIKGHEAIVVDEIMTFWNIKKVVKRRPSDNKKWGEEISPGVMTGLFGDAQFDRADLAHANIWAMPHFYALMDFTHPINFATICFGVCSFCTGCSAKIVQ